MIFDFPLAEGAGSFVVVNGAEAMESLFFSLKGLWLLAFEGLWLRDLCSLGLNVLGLYPWLIL